MFSDEFFPRSFHVDFGPFDDAAAAKRHFIQECCKNEAAATQHRTAPRSTAQHRKAPHTTAQHRTALYCKAPYCTAPYRTVEVQHVAGAQSEFFEAVLP